MMNKYVCSILIASMTLGFSGLYAAEPSKPNIIFIMCDDLGYGQIGAYGQKMIQTPRIDQMAQEGLLLTDYYSGTSVCAPSRAALMTGHHVGHTFIRGNHEIRSEIPQENGQLPIPDATITVAEKMKEAGYVTALVGKWGLGFPGSEGDPMKQGFDFFAGYNCQRHAHNYYPGWVWRNKEVIELGAKGTAEGYSHYFLTREARSFISENRDKPFFLYLAYTIPHSHLEIPADEPCYTMYQDKNWPQPQKIHAGMISLMDKDVGGIMDLLKELGIDKRTLVVFTSDNGPHQEGGAKPSFFQDSGPLRGIKRDMYEGGVRVPFVAWWPGVIEPGRRSDHIGAHWDLMPTACELASVPPPPNIDGISYVPLLKGNENSQPKHPYVYFELHRPDKRGLRRGDWVALQPVTSNADPDIDPIELYNLKEDLAQKQNLASQYPEKVSEFKKWMIEAHTPSKEFPFKAVVPGVKKNKAGSAANTINSETVFFHDRKPTGKRLPKRGWKVVTVSSESAFNGRTAATTIDENPDTWWHTQFKPSTVPHPHELVIDLQQTAQIDGLGCRARNDGIGTGTLSQFEVYISNDLQSFTKVAAVEFASPPAHCVVAFTPVKARYVKLKTLDSGNGRFACVAEIDLYGSEN
ncbi:Arylsulfatase precursor [Novipirellula aureliae]|uniref:Arylsulfatase n=1 Tax=Novipirellula aureliae TaxID=2527966 RepID=A0A5C6DG89_9BACT|nr:sulfatase-like hydrolase/transferase [Novipirellula aureliae]TWU34096.1 Arylsulfatase precursor [Novipirellula aureliae]